MSGKKIRRRPKHSKRHVAVPELTVRRLAALMDRDESLGNGITRAVEALEREVNGRHTLGVKGPH